MVFALLLRMVFIYNPLISGPVMKPVIRSLLLPALLAFAASEAHAVAIAPVNTVMSGNVSFSLPAPFNTNQDSMSYSVTTPLTGGAYTYSFTLSGLDVSSIFQIEIPLLSTNVNTADITNSGATASIVNLSSTVGPGFWDYSGGTSANGKTAFNSPNITNLLLISGLPTSTSWTLNFTSPYAPVNGVYQLNFGDVGYIYVDPPTPGAGVPEPAPWLLVATGLLLLAGMKLRKGVRQAA